MYRILKVATYSTASGVELTSKKQFQKFTADQKQDVLRHFQELNRIYGYYGAPPVPDNQVLHYLFDEVPTAGWPVVTVGKKQGDEDVWDTKIPFWNRATGPHAERYRRICDQGLGQLRPHRARVPAAL
ncbi:MAG: hypothetical protein R2867_15945 [Caldilineaceae bacterium]